MRSDIKIFSGSSNPELAKKVCLSLNKELSKLEITRFKDGEISVFVPEDVRFCRCFVVQSLCNPVNDNLMELLITVDALKRSHASEIVAIIPYFGYSRQERRCRIGEPISAKVVSKIISDSGIDSIVVVDLHANQIEGFFSVPVYNISNFENFIEDIRKIEGFNSDDFVIVAPDVGAAKRTRAFSKNLNCNMAIIDKHREKANCSEVMNIIGDVSSKSVILIDDIIDTAGTISNAAESLVKAGAKDVYIYATHAVCSGQAFQRLSSPYIKQIVFSDSIPLKENLTNIKVLSLAKTISSYVF